MGYTSGAKILADIIEEIANGLIATTGGHWTDADATWTTTTKTADLARRALKYTNGAEVIYLSLEARNSYYRHCGIAWSNGYAKGLRINFAASWDGTGHAPGTYEYYTNLQECAQGNAAPAEDLAILQFTYYLWIDASGFVLTAKPEPHADTYQGNMFVVVERNANKEYTDGFSNFYCFALNNYSNANESTMTQMRHMIRPFTYYSQDYNQLSYSGRDIQGIYFPLCPYAAYKGTGNGKVYYIKPVIFNSRDRRTPIFQAEMFFAFDEGVGLIDGDVIAIEGQTTKYLCKALDSPDNTTRLPFAIKYVA
jgi:hypothetical protein